MNIPRFLNLKVNVFAYETLEMVNLIQCEVFTAGNYIFAIISGLSVKFSLILRKLYIGAFSIPLLMCGGLCNYRPQTKLWEVMFPQVSVCHSVEEGGGPHVTIHDALGHGYPQYQT